MFAWATINQPGATDAPAEMWLEASGGGLSFEFAKQIGNGGRPEIDDVLVDRVPRHLAG